MYNISNKYKQFWYFIIKLTIVIGAGYFVYQQTWIDGHFQKKEVVLQVKSALLNEIWILPMLLCMTLINWTLEIIKWKTLAGTIQKITFKKAFKQSLSSHTLSLITPFKTGEYGGKALYFVKHLRKKILLLNFIGNAAQLLMTLLFGIGGLLYFLYHFDIPVNPYKLRRIGYLLAIFILMLFGGNKLWSYKKTGYYQRAIFFYRKLKNSIKLKILLFSLLRYLVFSHQFFLMLWLFGVEINYQTAILLIFTMYFLATMLPVMNLFDFVVKGSIAIYLFSFVGADEVLIMTISTLMWLFNFALPALVGSYYVMVFKTNIKPKFA